MTHRIEWLDAIAQVSAERWNRLLPMANPFVRHEFLHALEHTGSLRRDLGWRAHHLLLWQGESLVGAAPCYLKANSHGEFVFDWNWAEAYERAGGRYYPKLLCAVPYSPVSGPRLLAGAGADRQQIQRELLDAMRLHCDAHSWSSAHVNFCLDDEADLASGLGVDWLSRFDWQYHWRNPGYADFDSFLAALSSKKRKNIRQERARFRGEGWQIERHTGSDIDAGLLDDIYRFYAATFVAKGNVPALTREFFSVLVARMPECVLAVVASHNDERIAAAFFLQGAQTLYGRYWGCSEEIPGLHFECCYYQGIEHCIEQRLQDFEPGAQGEHKIARGFLPVRVHSRHYVRDAGFRTALAEHLKIEARHQEHYRALLMQHSPFRSDASPLSPEA